MPWTSLLYHWEIDRSVLCNRRINCFIFFLCLWNIFDQVTWQNSFKIFRSWFFPKYFQSFISLRWRSSWTRLCFLTRFEKIEFWCRGYIWFWFASIAAGLENRIKDIEQIILHWKIIEFASYWCLRLLEFLKYILPSLLIFGQSLGWLCDFRRELALHFGYLYHS